MHRLALRAAQIACRRSLPASGDAAPIVFASLLRPPRRAAAGAPARPAASVAAGAEWAEHEFRAVAEATLEALAESLADLEADDADVEFSQGVLTASLAPGRVYVLNTQTPNRQIWLSSPESGPWRYAWHADERVWRSTRDGHLLKARMEEEIGDVAVLPFDFGGVDAVLDEGAV